MAILVRYRWPGNVRELENVIYRSAVIAQGDAILVKNLPNEILEAAGEGSGLPIETTPTSDATSSASNESARAETNALTLERAYDFIFAELARMGEPMLAQVETALRARARQASAGDVAQAARLLGTAPAPTVVAGTSAARKRTTLAKKKS
jgi:two-component system nitrogen regulation response regulator GlnG